jgi:hypothetical protein
MNMVEWLISNGKKAGLHRQLTQELSVTTPPLPDLVWVDLHAICHYCTTVAVRAAQVSDGHFAAFGFRLLFYSLPVPYPLRPLQTRTGGTR